MTKLVTIIVTSLVTAGIMVWSLSVMLAPHSPQHGESPATIEEGSASH